MILSVTDFDIIYLSYDEPKYLENYADAKSKWPWIKHVHGIKGFDNAHKACADIAETERFVTIDGDNIVDEKFFEHSFEVANNRTDCVFSWSARNYVNGLLYGNGGLKCWPVEFVRNMKTHENSENTSSAVDFCWDVQYIQFEDTFCTTYTNGSPLQSFRAGFREGVKMTLDRGHRITLPEMDAGKLWHGNMKRFEICASVGADVKNGLWSMYGARLGAAMLNLQEWDHTEIADFDWFDEFWTEEVGPKFKSNTGERCHYMKYTWDNELLWKETIRLGDRLRGSLGLHVADLEPEASRFFRNVYVPPTRTGYN